MKIIVRTGLAILGICPLLFYPPVVAQTTFGLISGVVADGRSGIGIPGAGITAQIPDMTSEYRTTTNASGRYTFPLVRPGIYNMRVEASKTYRPTEIRGLNVPVAGFLTQDFSLRLLTDIWQTGQAYSASPKGGTFALRFYGPDVDITRSVQVEKADPIQGGLEPSLSYVIGAGQLRDLPLNGRDAYAALIWLPGVASDTSTVRGLGYSVNGQRPSAGSFILDGVENNNYLITGPLAVLPPEAIDEYRISTNNFSAEYGGTSGFLANVVTKAGATRWHGTGYAYFEGQALNANEFESNVQGVPKAPMHEYEGGFQTAGPLFRSAWFISTALDYLHSRDAGVTRSITVPTQTGIQSVPSTSYIGRLLAQFVPATPGLGTTASESLTAPVTIERWLANERMDRSWGEGASHWMGRATFFRFARPDYIWSPFAAFRSGLDLNTNSFASAYIRSWRPTLITELRLGYSTDATGWNRAHPEIPLLQTPLGNFGSPANYAFQNHGKTLDISASVVWSSQRNTVKIGGGTLFRFDSDSLTSPGVAYQIGFDTLESLRKELPDRILFEIDRPAARTGPFSLRDDDRSYRYRQFQLFAQDSIQLTRRLILHAGLRYEYFGAPVNAGRAKDEIVNLGPGTTFRERITNAYLATPKQGDQSLYSTDRLNLAPRLGFAWTIGRSGKTIVRASYGIFYDRLFDNLWLNTQLNNSVQATVTDLTAHPIAGLDISKPLAENFSLYQQARPDGDPRISPALSRFGLTLFQPGLRTPYVQSFFAGVQSRVGDRWAFDLNYAGSLGRKLITTDVVNRGPGRLNARLPDFEYHANQGLSDYHALTSSLLFRGNRTFVQVNYTWSHSIDNQSEPLGGFTTNLGVVSPFGVPIQTRPAAFTVQFDSRFDRGNSDFDQRHNFVVYSVWDVPPVLRKSRWSKLTQNWKVAEVSAVRSGLPFTIYALAPTAILLNNRANLVNPEVLHQVTPSIFPGARNLLNDAAFSNPGSKPGTSGRNAFQGPGLFSLDGSISRTFVVPRGESTRLVIRADLYNVLNHANLNNPSVAARLCCGNATGGAAGFSAAYFGRQDLTVGFPVFTPANETARKIQLMLRVEF